MSARVRFPGLPSENARDTILVGDELSPATLARRFPFLLIAWFVGHNLFVATASAYLIYILADAFDRKLADPKKQLAVSLWIKGQSTKAIQANMHGVIVDAFDVLYTHPLLRPTAFLRSLIYSSIAWMLYTYAFFRVSFYDLVEGRFYIHSFLAMLGAVILSDYLSTFVVRRCLVATERPLASIVAAMTVGILVISVFAVFGSIGASNYTPGSGSMDWLNLYNYVFFVRFFIRNPQNLYFMGSALLVYMWLPLFTIAALLARGIHYTLKSVQWCQWLIVRGERHVIRAVGIVAAAITFAVVLVAAMALPSMF